MLNNQHADGRGRRFQRDTEPRGGRRANQLHFARFGEFVEVRLRNQLGLARAKDEGRAAAADFLRRRSGVVFIDEEWKREGVVYRLVERNETVVGRKDALERKMNTLEELVQMRGFIQRVDDFGVDI